MSDRVLATLSIKDENGTSFAEVARVDVVIKSVTGKESRATLELQPMVVGSGPDAALQVDDAAVSKRHCELRLDDGGVFIRDLKSRNGTWVGQVKILEAVAGLQSSIRVGGSTLTFERQREVSRVPLSPEANFGDVVGASVPMRSLFATLAKVAATTQSLVLSGESGSGKEAIARAVHQHSPVRDGAFVVLDASTLSEQLAESELFGHVAGSFTDAKTDRAGLFETANKGTLFIDELGDVPLSVQPKLLRALESGQVRRLGSNVWVDTRPRIISASKTELRKLVAAGRLREDLYFRLAVVELRVPPLRERGNDIPLLVEKFLKETEPPLSLAALPAHSMELLQAHDWPGNVRELRNVVTRFAVLPDVGVKALERIMVDHRKVALGAAALMPLKEARDVVVTAFEKAYLTERLREHQGNVTAAAKAMGISRQMLHLLITKYELK